MGIQDLDVLVVVCRIGLIVPVTRFVKNKTPSSATLLTLDCARRKYGALRACDARRGKVEVRGVQNAVPTHGCRVSPPIMSSTDTHRHRPIRPGRGRRRRHHPTGAIIGWTVPE